jgi:hypothetical protein
MAGGLSNKANTPVQQLSRLLHKGIWSEGIYLGWNFFLLTRLHQDVLDTKVGHPWKINS